MELVLYSTGCPKCRILKKKLMDKDIPFVENTYIDEMEAMGISEVPVLSIDGVLFEFSAAVQWVNDQ